MEVSELLKIKEVLENLNLDEMPSDGIEIVDSISVVLGFKILDWHMSKNESEDE